MEKKSQNNVTKSTLKAFFLFSAEFSLCATLFYSSVQNYYPQWSTTTYYFDSLVL